MPANEWAAKIAILRVKAALVGRSVVVGSTRTYGCAEALLLDLSAPTAAAKVQALVEEAVLVTPRLMIARSHAAVTQWEQRLSEIYAEHDGAYIEKVRHRPSEGGGILTEAPVLREHVVMKRLLSRGGEGSALRVLLRLSGDTVNAGPHASNEVMDIVRRESAIPCGGSF